jgi:hypothetical protein
VCFCVGHRPSAHVAAGASWTPVIANAPWDARTGHTTVINATGAIYVIGGFGDTGNFRRVWVSTDGGADRFRGVLDGYVRVHEGLLRGYSKVLKGTLGVLKGYCPRDYLRGTQMVLPGYCTHARGPRA